MDAESVAAFGELGVDRLVLIPPYASPLEEVEAFMRDQAPERLGAEAL